MRSLLLALISTTALAQTAAVGGVDSSRGTTLLPGSSAWSDEATSLVYNPAGLGRVGRLNAWYVHERSNVRPQDNDGLWFATSIGDMVGLGVSFQWLRPGTGLGVDRAKSSMGFSVGPQAFSAGATLNCGLSSSLNTKSVMRSRTEPIIALNIFEPSRLYSIRASCCANER